MQSRMISVVVPTYREAENLPLLIPRVAEALQAAGMRGEILVVDDNSPDETPEVCAKLAQEYPVRLLVRTEDRGLSSAVLHGIRHAAGEIVVVMDADLSHPPEKVPELVRALEQPGVDFVIGSRYVAGGAVAEGWGLLRWLNSKGATLLCRPLTGAADPMAGFFAVEKQRVAAAARLDPIGYKIGLELIVKCGCRNVVEVPITFTDRIHGDSKLTMREQVNYLRHLRRLYVHKLGKAAGPVQFALVGASGLVVDMASFALLLAMLPLPAARASAIAAAMTWNFWLNRRMTFAHARHGNVFKQFAMFTLTCALGAVASWTTTMLLAANVAFFAAHPLLAAVPGILVGAFSNYALCSKAVFRRPRGWRRREAAAAALPQVVSERVTTQSTRMDSNAGAGVG